MMRKNIFITYIVLIIICIVISGLIPLKITRSNYLNMIEERLSNDALMIRDHILDTYDEDELDSFAKNFRSEFNVRVTIVDDKGRVMADSDADIKNLPNHSQRPEIKKALQGALAVRHGSTFSTDMMYMALPLHDRAGAIRLAMSIDYIKRHIRSRRLWPCVGPFSLSQANIFPEGCKPIYDVSLAEQMADGNFEGRMEQIRKAK